MDTERGKMACYKMGNCNNTMDPIEASQILMKREYPHIEKPKSVTIIPDFFIPNQSSRINLSLIHI